MRKTILATVLAVVSGSAMAEWALLGSANYLGMAIYADPATIRKNGNFVKMWNLYDYKTTQPGPTPYMSSKKQMEYDCKEEQLRTTYVSFYSANMSDGVLLYSSKTLNNEWMPVAPGTTNEGLWKFACGKR